jgi:hypothetical protein
MYHVCGGKENVIYGRRETRFIEEENANFDVGLN